jgi:hypothetical protein
MLIESPWNDLHQGFNFSPFKNSTHIITFFRAPNMVHLLFIGIQACFYTLYYDGTNIPFLHIDRWQFPSLPLCCWDPWDCWAEPIVIHTTIIHHPIETGKGRTQIVDLLCLLLSEEVLSDKSRCSPLHNLFITYIVGKCNAVLQLIYM